MGEPRRNLRQRRPRRIGDQPKLAAEIITRNLERNDAVDRERNGGGRDPDPRRDHAQAPLVALAASREARPDAMASEEAARRVEEFARLPCEHPFATQLCRADTQRSKKR